MLITEELANELAAKAAKEKAEQEERFRALKEAEKMIRRFYQMDPEKGILSHWSKIALFAAADAYAASFRVRFIMRSPESKRAVENMTQERAKRLADRWKKKHGDHVMAVRWSNRQTGIAFSVAIIDLPHRADPFSLSESGWLIRQTIEEAGGEVLAVSNLRGINQC